MNIGCRELRISRRLRAMFGEIGEMCDKPHAFTMRTRKLSQLLRLSECALLDKIQMIKSEAKRILNNFFQVCIFVIKFLLELCFPSFPSIIIVKLTQIFKNIFFQKY